MFYLVVLNLSSHPTTRIYKKSAIQTIRYEVGKNRSERNILFNF